MHLELSLLHPRRAARGFTLLELLAVVAIIAILAATALPGMVERMRDRRGNQVAQAESLFFRQARARAMGRGAAQLVRFRSAPDEQGQLVLFEAVQPNTGKPVLGCGPLPPTGSNSCLMTLWPAVSESGGGTYVPTNPYRYIDTYAPAQTSSDVYTRFFAAGNEQKGDYDVCFTPTGRAYAGDYTKLMPFTGVLRLEVERRANGGSGEAVGVIRQVLVPANGAARLVL